MDNIEINYYWETKKTFSELQVGEFFIHFNYLCMKIPSVCLGFSGITIGDYYYQAVDLSTGKLVDLNLKENTKVFPVKLKVFCQPRQEEKIVL